MHPDTGTPESGTLHTHPKEYSIPDHENEDTGTSLQNDFVLHEKFDIETYYEQGFTN